MDTHARTHARTQTHTPKHTKNVPDDDDDDACFHAGTTLVTPAVFIVGVVTRSNAGVTVAGVVNVIVANTAGLTAL